MTHAKLTVHDSAVGPSDLATLLEAIPPARRGAVLQSAVSCRSAPTLEHSFAVGPIRAAFIDYWRTRFGAPIPVEQLRAVLQPPVPIGTVLEFNKLMLTRNAAETKAALDELADHLKEKLRELDRSTQLRLFEVSPERVPPNQRETLPAGDSVRSLRTLVEQGRRFGSQIEKRLF